MTLNLDQVRSDIQTYLEARCIAVFQGFASGLEDVPAVYWDTAHHPDYRDFLAVAEAAGVRLVALHANQFSEDVIDDALDRLAQSDMSGADRATMERRLREMRRYDGFTCQIELSFDHPPRVYIFDLRTDWFQELNDMLEEIDDASDDHRLDFPDSHDSGFFSKN
jgi:hypothetical protein